MIDKIDFLGSLSTVVVDKKLQPGEDQIGSLLFDIQRAMRILVLKFSKFRKPKAFRLMTLMRIFVVSSFAFE